MHKFNKVISYLLTMCILSASLISGNILSVYAENTNAEIISEIEEKSEIKDELTSDIDNSELDVRVIHQTGDEQSTVFEGKLKDYDNGRWVNMDFADIDFFVILDWDNMEDEAIYIIPRSSDTEIVSDTNISTPSDESINEVLSSGAALTSQNSNIHCDVNLMYDGAYSEKVIIRNKELTVPVKITNNGSTDKNVVCYIAEYDENGVLRNTIAGSTVTVAKNKSVATQVTKVFSQNTKTVKIFVWDSETLQPITGAISLDETEQDYYANTAAEAQEYDISYQIKGKINTASDVDYIKFVPKTTGEYTFNCISTTNAVTALYGSNQNTLKSAASSYKYSLTAEETYYLKTTGNVGDYVLSVQYNVPGEADGFDVYKFDVDTNIYKKSIKDTCDSLYYSNKSLAKQMYDEYEDILGEEAKLHRLPDFLSDHPKDLSNFDDLLNQYYGTKYEEFAAVRQKYIDLIDRYAELTNSASSNISSAETSESAENISEETVDVTQNETVDSEVTPDSELHPIIGKYISQGKQRENIEIGDIRPGEEIKATQATPSLTIVSKTTDSIKYKVTFPVSKQWGNIIQIVDFNRSDGLTLEKNQYDNDEYRESGEYTISNLSPGGIYIIGMWWSTDGKNCGYDNSIYRFVQLPNNTSETYKTYYGGRVAARIETADRALASDSAINAWVNNMDKAYNAYKDLTGYTPYRSRKIEMCSTRDNLNDIMGIKDGKNYWTVIFGYYSWGSTAFQHARAFYQGHLRRLSKGDWGDTPMHELSHVFDNDKWNFDAETLAQLKLYYVISTLNAKVYRPDRYDNDSKGWYTGDNYYTLLRSDRYLDSYDESFGNGTYASEGFASILIDIQKKIGWDAFKKTFRYFSSLSKNMNDGEKLKLFLTKLKDYSGKDVLGYISSRDTRIIESQFGIDLEYVEPEYPKVSGGSGGGGRSEINVDKGNYSVFQFMPTTSGNYYIYTSPYAGSGVSNDTYIEVYTNANLSGTPIASNDDYDGGRFSKVSIAATENTTYYIKVRHYASGQLHAELNITKDAPVQPLTLDANQDIITSSGEFALFSFTPDNVGAYSFEVGNYNGGTTAYDTYIKLYDNISMTKRLGNDEKKIVANLQAGHTYYLQFSGFLMKYARGRISVSQGQTLQFTKRSDSSFIYVNSPEYITRFDIVDDISHTQPVLDKTVAQPYMKLSEFENITGKNTFYETHTAWWGELVKAGNETYSYDPLQQFYLDIDMYNPTSSPITISIENLAYGVSYSDLQQYYNGNFGYEFTIQPQEHIPIFSHINAPLLCREKDAGTWARIPVILFDFTVHSGKVTISTIAAYDRNNLYLRNGTKNVVDNTGATLDAGNVICAVDDYGNMAWGTLNDPRRNETDLYGKMKGIARNESAWIDSDIELVIDDNTELGTPIPLTLKDSYYTYGIANPKWSWKSAINPLNDAWDGVLTMLPNGLHNFKYHYNNTNRQWYFDFQHRDLRNCDINGSSVSVNNSVPADIIDNAKRDMAAGRKVHFAEGEAPDEYSMSIGEWGATYHYTVTVKNTTSNNRTANIKMWSAENMIFGLKKQGETAYSTNYYAKIYNTPNTPTNTATVSVPANSTTTFEFVTLLGGGLGGLNHSIVIE